MTIRIALRNLLHDRVRLAVTLIGVIFAVVLIAVQGGLFVGFTRTTSCVIENTEAEVWVASRGVRNFDVTHPLPGHKFHQIDRDRLGPRPVPEECLGTFLGQPGQRRCLEGGLRPLVQVLA